jgi:hypothetical protein
VRRSWLRLLFLRRVILLRPRAGSRGNLTVPRKESGMSPRGRALTGRLARALMANRVKDRKRLRLFPYLCLRPYPSFRLSRRPRLLTPQGLLPR